ncbi:spermidine synthase [Desulfitobacterium sp. Sab5]|uniref:spermidine synthase n=1 Tax=Desulfitobacterium nosdiversum TaxID=3375356 RepID=UPI003CF09FF1
MSKGFMYFYVFFAGAAVMSIEMTASRLIAPFFGTSLMVWANIIGIILLAMSAGYYIGGRWADRTPKPAILFSISLISGLLLTAIPLISQFTFGMLTEGILGTPIKTILLAFVGTLLVFAPPIFLLAMVSPFALRLSVTRAEETGKIAGRLSAFSTLGSLLGTFLPSLVLIPSIGTRNTIYVSALILITISGLGLKKAGALLLTLLPLLLIFFGPRTVKAGSQVVWEKETPYQYVQVVKEEDGSTSLIYNEGGGVQSIARPNHQLLPQDYYDYYLILPFLRETGKEYPFQTWILGSAGGTMLGQFNYWIKPILPQLSLTGVEIDPDVIPLGQKYFGLNGSEGKVVNADGRSFLRSQKGKADLVIVDAYSNQIYIPFHLSTQEFFSQVKAKLNPSGMLALNVNALSSSSPLLQAFENTLCSVFNYTYLMPIPGSLNYVLIGSDKPIILSTPPNELPEELKPFYSLFQTNIKRITSTSGQLLTDDRAPVEFLTDQMIWEGIRQGGI